MPHSKGWRGRRDRRTRQETPLGEVLDGLLREQAFARGLPIGQLAAAWESIVGPRLAAETAPMTLEQGVLVVAVSTGPWGAQARFLAAQIQRRANEALGEPMVQRVQIVVRAEPRKGL
jgi:predicted nucleic acid-binding Zn ribbon protein